MGDEELIRDWEKGRPVEADRTRKSPSSVLSLRLSDDVMTVLNDQAQAQGKTAGTYARELLMKVLAEDTPSTLPSLANMFSRWVSEAMSSAATPTVDVVFASETIARKCWVSYEKHPLIGDTYELMNPVDEYFSFARPLLTSRTKEIETEPAGDNAA